MADYRSEYQEAYERRLAQAKERVGKFPILRRVGEARVFGLDKLPGGLFELMEECDRHFGLDLTAEELAALGQELIELSKT